MNTDIDKHRRLAAHASLRPWGISQGMLVSVDPTGLKLVVADCNYENGTPNLYFLANIANDHAAMIDEIERLRERNAKLEQVYKAALDAVNWVGDLRWQYPLVRALQNAKEETDD